MNEMQQRQEESAEQRNLARLWAMGTQDVEIDRQGRMVIPPFLREYARLNDEVLVHGALDRVELWNPEEWAAKVAPAETTLVAEDAPVLKGSYSTKKPNLTTGSDSTRGSGSTTKRSDATTGIDATKKADATKKGGS